MAVVNLMDADTLPGLLGALLVGTKEILEPQMSGLLRHGKFRKQLSDYVPALNTVETRLLVMEHGVPLTGHAPYYYPAQATHTARSHADNAQPVPVTT
jgi:hypothetical protein